jgi:hypothetical protein
MTSVFLLLLSALFAGLAVDALRTHGPRSPGFQPKEADPNSHDPMQRPLARRSGRSVAAVFAALASMCGLAAWLSN